MINKGLRNAHMFKSGSRPSDKGGGGTGGGGDRSPRRDGPGLKKNFSALRASVWSKRKGRGGGAPPLGPFPGSAAAFFLSLSPYDCRLSKGKVKTDIAKCVA